MNINYNFNHMVYLRIFEGCNAYCEHCFIPNNPKKIEKSFFENNNISKILEKNTNIKKNDKIYLQWHGGEPTLLGPLYLKEAIENIEKDKNYKFEHGIQTNLINFNENYQEWINLYKTYFNSHIGISWDYKIRHLRKNMTNLIKSNEDFEKIFWNNVNILQKENIDLYMVITVTKLFFNYFKNPFDFFNFIVDKGIKKINFERITNNGFAREKWDYLGLNNAEYSSNMSKFFNAYKIYKKNNPDISLNISPFDGLELSLINRKKQKNIEDDILSFKKQGYGCWSGECDTTFHTIDSNGYKKGCTALTSEEDNKNKELKKIIILKNINIDNRNLELKRKNRQEDCINCEFLNVCSSGCLNVEKFDVSGECSGAKNLFNTIKNYLKA